MKVGIGYSDNPVTIYAGVQAVEMAIKQAGRKDPCDLALLFSTARHDQSVLREAVASIAGKSVPIYGGGTVGIITNEYFGYAGDQIEVACIWLDGVRCDVITEAGLEKSEVETGVRLGQRLAALGTKQDSPVMLFYDALDCGGGESGGPPVRMLMATWLLEGIEKGLGFFPDLNGAGLMGDHACSPTRQWVGDTMGDHSAIALAFSGDIRVDSVIMHGCRPATQYYTVTKAEGPVILEINGKPAIQFMNELLGSVITPEEYPFYLIFGINHGERWGEYDEDYYASRLCLGIDKERGGIVMFEPDMVPGTEFQLMFQTLELDYIKPKIDKVFSELDDRVPVFAVYIDCAGRCAGYGGLGMEDAVVIQQSVAGRAPVLGLYTGVEIASIGGRPRGLDWTGVFCLFSRSKDGKGALSEKKTVPPVWDSGNESSQLKEIPVEAMIRLSEHNAAKITELNRGSIAIRHELEQKRRSFSLLSELSISLRQNAGHDSVFIPAARRINAALNMQRTVVLEKNAEGLFTALVMQGYTAEEKDDFKDRHIKIPEELFNPDKPVLVTGAEAPDKFRYIRELLGLPYFISSPVILQGEVLAVLITGRLVEAPPYLVRLSAGDMETVQAITALLSSVLGRQRLAVAEERNQIMVNAMPVGCCFWDENGYLTDCNKETLSLFGLSNKEELNKQFYSLSPEYQPDGRLSANAANEYVMKAYVSGSVRFKWTHLSMLGDLFPTEVTLVRVPKGEDYILAGYIYDLRDQETAIAKQEEALKMAVGFAKARNEFLASVSHEIRTPLNAIQSMARIAGEINTFNEKQQNIIRQGMLSAELLTTAIETILDFSKLDSGQLALEISGFSVRDLMDEIGEMARREAKSKSLYLRVSVDPEIPGLTLGDPKRLRQLLFNIVINAVKFTESGGVDIRVHRDGSGMGSRVSLIFEVQDTGIGIAEEHMSEIFKPMFSGDMSYTRKYQGMGMGLATSSGLAALMGGKITCESIHGKGSIFRLFISLALPEKKSAKAEKAKASFSTETLRGMRVLVAEDNNINQMIIEELLSSAGIEVTMADNGIMAIERLEENDFDLILMDIQMPEMDGLTAASRIRSDPRYTNLPILAMTANAGAEHLEESIKAGMNDHLTKPVETEKLYEALLKWGRKSGKGK